MQNSAIGVVVATVASDDAYFIICLAEIRWCTVPTLEDDH